MTIKDEDGTEIKLTVLETPIAIDSLQFKNEITEMISKKLEKYRETDDSNANIILLKTPICLDDIDWGNDNKVTINIETVKGTYKREKTKVKCHLATWKISALKLFENSRLYPFIHASNKYKCFACTKPFLDANLLKEHCNSHTLEEYKRGFTYRCRDKTVKVDVADLKCNLCSVINQNIQALIEHLKDHGIHVDKNCKDNLVPFKLGADKFICQVCGEDFTKLRLLVIHMNKHYNNYSCEVCGSVFISLILLKTHQKCHQSGSFPCDRCDKVFSSSGKRKSHIRGVHLKQYPRRCPYCSERFNSDYQRTKHLRLVHNQNNSMFRCETCGREYDLKNNLLKHIRSVHLQERNQECPVCHARFFAKYCLSRHMVIHTGEKNFKCDVCGKTYARRRNLRMHFKSHENLQIICNVCRMSFGNQAGLVAHLSSAHGVI